jgi:hypothetical protein
MSKPEQESPAAAPETSVESQSSASSTSQKSIYDLLKLDVSKFIEKKQGLSYVSWAHAWAIALNADPYANFRVHTFGPNGDECYMRVNGTAMVWVDVTLFSKSITCWLPVMDHRNKPIADPDSFQVNTALMRCLTKALGFHGLGLNVYAGEDLPLSVPGEEEDKPAKVPAKAQKDSPKEPVKEPVKEEAKSPDEDPQLSAELFTDGFVEYMIVVQSTDGLNSYWKSNQTKLDKLKAKYPDLYERCLSVAKDRKQQLSKE